MERVGVPSDVACSSRLIGHPSTARRTYDVTASGHIDTYTSAMTCRFCCPYWAYSAPKSLRLTNCGRVPMCCPPAHQCSVLRARSRYIAAAAVQTHLRSSPYRNRHTANHRSGAPCSRASAGRVAAASKFRPPFRLRLLDQPSTSPCLLYGRTSPAFRTCVTPLSLLVGFWEPNATQTSCNAQMECPDSHSGLQPGPRSRCLLSNSKHGFF